MAKRNRILVKIPSEVSYLDNNTNEKVTYLKISNGSEYSVSEDIKNGAEQFQDVLKLTEKKHLSRVVTVSADNRELGLMAISYIAMSEYVKYAKKDDFLDEDLFEDEYLDEQWVESAGKIPVINLDDIMSYFKKTDIPFEREGTMYNQLQMNSKTIPYWFSCRKEAICVVIPREDADDGCMELLDIFSHNKHVYALFLENEVSSDTSDFFMGTMDKKKFSALKNNYVLSNASDIANISLVGVDSRKYYKNVFKQNVVQRGIKTARGFSYDKAVALAETVDSNKVCEMIDKIINYALKDVEDTEKVVFNNSSFDFVTEFTDDNKRVAKNGKSGRQLLEETIVGMEDIKRQVLDVVNVMKYNKIRSEMNISGSRYHNVHLMLGAPGTAKTTVASIMGKIMLDEKLLPDSRVICINGAQLKGMYVGHSAPKTKHVFDNHDVIIIDEAYSLVENNGNTDSFGNEAIAQMIIEMENHSTDKLVIFAGYGGLDVNDKDNKMKSFLDANPGIKSRITSTFYFKSYTADDMGEIFLRIAKTSSYDVEEGSKENVVEYFKSRIGDANFGNGREARALLENASLFAARRLMESGKENYEESDMRLLTKKDIENAISKAKLDNRMDSREKGKIGF